MYSSAYSGLYFPKDITVVTPSLITDKSTLFYRLVQDWNLIVPNMRTVLRTQANLFKLTDCPDASFVGNDQSNISFIPKEDLSDVEIPTVGLALSYLLAFDISIEMVANMVAVHEHEITLPMRCALPVPNYSEEKYLSEIAILEEFQPTEEH